MAIATMNTILEYKDASEFVKLVDIKDYPDLGSAPELIETTTLTQTERHTNIKGLQDATDLTFTANYTLADYEKVKALEGEEHEFQLKLGADGVDGIFGWKGELSVYLVGGGVNEVREMTITVTESEPMALVG
ncbi:MAG TPA: hypothetical protein VFC79_14250 [Tissierellaceae bacterium]|nr:hypothetical protein [Tissierellaceae bacterium]